MVDNKSYDYFLFAFLLVIAVVIIISGYINSYELNAFNNTLTSESLSFTGNQNITRYIDINRYSTVSSAYMNLSGNNSYSSECYQESANVSTSCGGLNTGSYIISGTLTNLINGIDKNWASATGSPSSLESGTILSNYSKPSGATSAKIQFETYAAILNYTLPASCFNNENIEININIGPDSLDPDNIGEISISCNTDSGSVVIFYLARDNNFQMYFNEEAIIWNMTYSNISNPFIEINNSNVWNVTGTFNTTDNKTIDLSSTLNTALNNGACDCDGCIALGNNCSIPFIFHSDTAGILQYSALNITYDYDTTPPTLTQIPISSSNFNKTTIDMNVSSNENLTWCGVSINSGANRTMTQFNATYYNATNSTMTQGYHSITFSCNDTSNNYASATSTNVLVDTVYPGVNFTNPTPYNQQNWTSSSVYVNYTSTDTNNVSSFIDWNSTMVAWWRLEQGNGTFFEDYEGINNATCSVATCPTFTYAGARGGAYEFDGINDYITDGNNGLLNLSFPFSISLWMNPKTITGSRKVINKGALDIYATQNYAFGIQTSSYRFNVGDGTNYKYVSAAASTGMQHIVLVANTINDLQIWRNGVQLSVSYTGTGTGIAPVSDNLKIGYAGAASTYFNGTIDDIIIFSNRSLAQEEIYSLYNSSRTYHNFTGLTLTNYSYVAYSQDRAGNLNITETRTVNIDAGLPGATLLNPPDNFFNNTDQNYTANLTDDSGIKNATLNIYNHTTGELVNETTTTYSPGITNTVLGIVVTLADGIYDWFYDLFDFLDNHYATENRTITIDTINPSLIDINFSLVNGTFYSGATGRVYRFNITATDTNLDTVLFEFNYTNYTMSNLAGNIYNFSIQGLSAGTYHYRFSANDSAGNINNTWYGDYVIRKRVPEGTLTSSNGWIIDYGKGTTIGYTESNLGDSDVTYVINRDNILIGAGETVNLTAGVYEYKLNTTGGANYSTRISMNKVNLTINKLSGNVSVFLNNSRSNITIVEGTYIWLNATLNHGIGDIDLQQAGTSINFGTSPLSNYTLFDTAGTYKIDGMYSGNANYTAGIETFYVIVTPASATTVTLTSPQNNKNLTTLSNYFSSNGTATLNDLVNATLFIYNSTKGIVTTYTNTVSGLLAGTNNSYTLPSYSNYTWNVKYCDGINNCYWSNTNYSLNVYENTTLNLSGNADYKFLDSARLKLILTGTSNSYMKYCNFSVANPNGQIILNNVNGTYLNNVWNSTAFSVNITGNYSTNVTCKNNHNAVFNKLFNLSLTYNFAYMPPSYDFATITNKTEVRSIPITMYDDSLNSITFTLSPNIQNSSNFTMTLVNNTIVLNDSDSVSNQRSATLYINAINNYVANGSYAGNITFSNATYNLTYYAYFNYTISDIGFGNPVIRTADTDIECSDAFGSTCYKTFSVHIGSSYSLSYNFTNAGSAELTNCSPKFEYRYSGYNNMNNLNTITYNKNNFNLTAGNSTIVATTFSPAVGTDVNLGYQGYLYLKCAETENAINNRPYIIASIQAALTPGGGGGGPGTTIIEGGEYGWTMTTDVGTQSYDMRIISGLERTKTLIFKNVGASSKKVRLTCEGTSEFSNLCNYIKFDRTEIDLPVGEGIETITTFTISPTEDMIKQRYVTNIIGTDGDNNRVAVTINAETQFGEIIKLGVKASSDINLFGIVLPIWFLILLIFLILIIIFSLMLRKVKPGGIAIAFGLALLISAGVLYFI